jgi:hypothetical protein
MPSTARSSRVRERPWRRVDGPAPRPEKAIESGGGAAYFAAQERTPRGKAAAAAARRSPRRTALREPQVRMSGKLFAALLVALAVAATSPLSAATGATSSKGYSLPSSSSSSKGYAAPPATAAPRAAPTVPDVSRPPAAGASRYALPGAAPSAAARSTGVPQSASDAAVARQGSGAALKNYVAQREQSKFAATPTPVAAPSGAFSSYAGRFPSYDAYYANRNAYYGGFGWSAPPYIYASRPSFGMWDALFLWFMLDTVGNASHAAWFYNHADDPGYQQWRQEANRLSADNADLHAKLDALDAKQREMAGQPRDPAYMPADAKPAVALAPENAVGSEIGGHASPNWWLLIAVLAVLGCAVFAYHHGHVRRIVHH